MVDAIVDILRTVLSNKAQRTLTLIVRKVVQTLGVVLTRIYFFGAELDLFLAVFTCPKLKSLGRVFFNLAAKNKIKRAIHSPV